MSMHEVSSLLWHERELLDVLLFKLEEEQLLLTAGRTRWLPRATAEIDLVQKKLSEITLAVSVEISAVAVEWGLPEGSSLITLAQNAPEDGMRWAEILEAHQEALTIAVAEMAELRDANEHLIRASIRATQETIANFQASPSTYNARGITDTFRSAARLIDKEL